MKACTVKFVIIMLRDRLCSRSGNLFLPHVLHVSLMYLKRKKKKCQSVFQTHVLGLSLRHGAFSYQLLQFFFYSDHMPSFFRFKG